MLPVRRDSDPRRTPHSALSHSLCTVRSDFPHRQRRRWSASCPFVSRALSQKTRTAIHAALADLGTDPDAVEEFLSHFPSRDLDEPVTKEFLRVEMAELRTEVHHGFQRMTLGLAALMVSMTGVMVAAVTFAR